MSSFALESAYTPEQSAPPPTPKGGTFSLNDAYGAPPAPEAAPAEEPKKKGFWANMTEGGWEGYLRGTLPAQIADRMGDVREATVEFERNKEEEKELARRKAAGESTDGMLSWKMKRINDIVASHKPQTPDPSVGEIWDGIKKAAVADPMGFAGKAAQGFIQHPELIFTPELLPARMAEIAGTVGKVGAEAAQIGTAVAAESSLEQLNRTGKVNPAQTAIDTAMTAAPIVVGRTLMPKGKAQVTLATDLALAKTVKEGGVQSPEMTKQVVADVEAKVAEGTPLHQAQKEALEAVKVSPEAADDAASLFKPEEGVADAKGNKSGQVLPETQGKEGEVKRGGDLPVIDQAKPALGEEPQGAEPRAGPLDNLGEELRAASRGEPVIPKPAVKAPEETNVIRPQAFKPLPEEVPNRFATAEEARKLYEMAGMEPEIAAKIGDKPIAMGAIRQRLTKFMGGQKYADGVLVDAAREGVFGKKMESGKIDPVLLGALGLTGLGGAAYALYTKDPSDAIKGALVTGGVLAAGALLHRSVKGVGEVMDHLKDRHYRITHLTDDFWASVESGRLANYRFSEQIRTMVSNPKMREQITHALQGDAEAMAKLSPEARQAASEIEEYFKTMGEKGQRAGVLPDELIDNYVTQLWTGLKKGDSLFRNLVQSLGQRNVASPGMSPKSKFSMKRLIPSYKEGMAAGMIPSTLDIADIIRIYGDNINRTIANKNLISAVSRERTPWGEALMVRDTPQNIAKEIAKAAAIIDKQWQAEGKLADDIRKFAIGKAPKEYVTIDHPQMRGFKVHEDIAPVMKWLFDANNPNAVTKLFYAVSVAAKRGLFSYSLFHVKSLADALLGTSAKGWLNVINGNAAKMLREGHQGDILDELVKGGLRVVEKPLEGDVTPFANSLKLIEEKYPIIGAPAKGLRIVGKAMDAFLWGVVHPTFKAAAGMAAFEKTLKRSPELTRAQAAKAAASFTNDIFGSLDWFRISDEVQNKFGRDLALAVTSPSGRRFMQIMMLAPDWTIATTRAMVKAIPGVSKREIAALHQGYVVRSALLYLSVAEGLNQYFAGHHIWENEDPTMVDLGDGRKLQLSKHFMEPIHWLLNPAQQALNKLGYVIKEPVEQAMNKQYLSTKGAPPIRPDKASTTTKIGKTVEHALGSAMPITGQQAFENGTMPAISGFFGFPVYGKTEEQYVDAAKKRAADEGKDIEAAGERARKRRERAKAKAEEARK